MAIWVQVPGTRLVPDSMGLGKILYLWVAPVPDLNRDSFGVGIFFHSWVTRRIPDTLLPL
jgi:hypothetical protein